VYSVCTLSKKYIESVDEVSGCVVFSTSFPLLLFLFLGLFPSFVSLFVSCVWGFSPVLFVFVVSSVFWSFFSCLLGCCC